MIVVTPSPERVIDVARTYDIDSKQIGYVTKGSEIRIKNNGFFKSDSHTVLVF